MGSKLKMGLITGVAVMAAAVPTSAWAAEGAAIYPPDLNARSFVTGDGGWERGSNATGLCLPPLTCPSIGGGFVASGGTLGPADGFLNTTIGGLTGVGSESRGVLRSPEFVYNGVNGEKPTDLAFAVSHQSDIGSLLSVAGNSVDYSVEIVAGGNAKRIVATVPLIPTEGWTDSAVATLNRNLLAIGQTYRFRLITRFVYGAQVIPGGAVGYDDVILFAAREEADVPPGGGGGGGGNNNGGGGGGGGAGNNQAVFDGRNLFIKLKCFGVQNKKGKCHTRATAFKTKGGTRYTFPIQRMVKAKKGKVIRARVRFQYRKELEKAKSIVLRSVLSENRKRTDKVTKFKKLKLIDKSPD